MSATTLPTTNGTATGQPKLLPAKSAQRLNNVQFGHYGANVATHDRRAGIHAEIGWNVELVAGYHEIWAQYSAAETRPMTMKLDGSTILEAALWDTPKAGTKPTRPGIIRPRWRLLPARTW